MMNLLKSLYNDLTQAFDAIEALLLQECRTFENQELENYPTLLVPKNKLAIDTHGIQQAIRLQISTIENQKKWVAHLIEKLCVTEPVRVYQAWQTSKIQLQHYDKLNQTNRTIIQASRLVTNHFPDLISQCHINRTYFKYVTAEANIETTQSKRV